MQRIRLARSARKHHVGKHRIVAAMRHSGVPDVQADGSLLFTGRDTSGKLLHVGAFTAAEDDQLMIVFHAQPLEW